MISSQFVKSLQLAATAAVTFALAAPTLAQTTTDHVRGKVTSISADAIAVQPRHGPPVSVKLTPTWGVVLMKTVDVSAIVPGSFIGTTTIERPDGTGKSLEVHVFPPGVKMGQGHYPWDLKPHSMMTNGDVGKVVTGPKGRTIEVSYPGGMHTVLVPANVPIVTTVGGDRAMVKVGVRVFMVPTKGPDGALVADRVLVGEKGAAPPM